jgi:hypothetical protein
MMYQKINELAIGSENPAKIYLIENKVVIYLFGSKGAAKKVLKNGE